MCCETLIILKNIQAVDRDFVCPWYEKCQKNLSGEICEVARTVEAFDPSKQPKIKLDYNYTATRS